MNRFHPALPGLRLSLRLWLPGLLLLSPVLPRLRAADAAANAVAATSAPPAAPLFLDRNLESAVRKFVFEKRDNDKPLVEADLATLSTIEAKGLAITNLAGLEKCRELASLDLSRNKIADLSPLKDLSRLQSLSLSDNAVQDLSPLGSIAALQYLELSRNKVKDLQPLAGCTNLSALYLSQNAVEEIAPLHQLTRLSSLYLDQNRLKSIEGLGRIRGLFTLSLSQNQISDVKPLTGLTGLSSLFLEGNKIKDLAPLVEWAAADKEQRFAPFLNLYLKGNPLSSAAKGKQTSALKEIGVRVNP